MSRFSNIKNYFFPTTSLEVGRKQVTQNQSQHNLAYSITPLQFLRIRQDIASWRLAIIEAEQAYYPHRVKMQRLFQDTVINEHVDACMSRRKNLTLLRKFRVVDQAGNEIEDLTKLLQKPWFKNFESYALDAKFYGYSLIALGDAVNDGFPQLSIIKRQNVSPDRKVVGSLVYQLSGINFTEQPYSDWHIWVDTPNETGSSPCGFGLLYKIAKAEIYLRNNMAHNADYNEIFGQPIRKGRTTKTDETERANFERALQQMGSSAYILLDDGTDDVELVESSTTGRAHLTYTDFEKRNEQKISKVILGHGDALDSVPGKLGAGSGEDNPVAISLADIQSEDGSFLENLINEELFTRMRNIGFQLPITARFEYVNDQEAEEFRMREDESNTKTATLFKTISDAGGELDEEAWKYFADRTGIPVKAKKQPEPIPNPLNPIDPTKVDPKLTAIIPTEEGSK
jgi:hypothetical protein